MKPWRLLLAVALAAVAVLLLTSLVVAAQASTTVQIGQVFDSPILTNTLPMTHPVGIVLALYFNIPYTQVMSLHDQGWGFGNIARAYLTALNSGGVLTPALVLDLRQAGMGWGQIKREYGVHPGGNGLGSIMGHKHDAPRPESTTLGPLVVKPGDNGSSCPGNSCNAPGQIKPDKGPQGPKNK